jgi:hypothetical protein
VDGGGLDRDVWVVREGGSGGLEEHGRAIWPSKGSSDSHLSGPEGTPEQTKSQERIKKFSTNRTTQR